MTTLQTEHVTSTSLSGREELKRAQKEYGYSEEQLRNHLRALFMERNLVEDVGWFDDMFNTWFRMYYKSPASPNVVAQRAAARQSYVASLRQKIEQRDNRIRVEAKTELLALAMPNGKLLGDCTFGEVAVFTGTYRSFLERLAHQGRPKQKIKTVCSEARLLELWNTGGANNPSAG